MKIKLNLNQSEYDPLARTAEAFGCDVEDLVYTAVDEFMTRLGNFDKAPGAAPAPVPSDVSSMREAVLNTKRARSQNLPVWADSAASVHVYEGMPDEEPSKSKNSKF